jgi:tRNA pseudouridine13 synthase
VNEEFVGIKDYITKTEGIGGRIKTYPEDFVVNEIAIDIKRKSDGKNTILKVKLKNWENNRFVFKLAMQLGVRRDSIFFAGTKDKRAVKTQYFCIRNFHDKVKIDLKDVEILESFRTDDCIDIGDLIGNEFSVIIRNLNSDAEVKIKKIFEELPLKNFPNFFGVQRFGSSRPVTHIVGKYILNGDYENAVRAYIGLIFDDHDSQIEARKYFYETGDAENTLKMIDPGKMEYEKILLKHLIERPGDYAGAISRLPRTLRMMFIHGYQSYLFNKILSERMKKYGIVDPLEGDIVLPVDKNGLPIEDRYIFVNSKNMDKIKEKIREGKAYISAILYGSDSRFADGEMGEIERKIIENENINPNMFKIKDIKDISSKGSRRSISSPVKNFEYYFKENYAQLNFSLIRGSYATSLIREFMKVPDLLYY